MSSRSSIKQAKPRRGRELTVVRELFYLHNLSLNVTQVTTSDFLRYTKQVARHIASSKSWCRTLHRHVISQKQKDRWIYVKF